MALSSEAVMRRQPALSAIAILVVVSLVPVSTWAQGNPSTDQIVKSLTPTPAMGTTRRGIRTAPGGSAAGSSATGGSTAAAAQTRPAAAEAPAVSMNVQFATGSAKLTQQAIQTLTNLGQALTNPSLANYRFRIEGHTDTVGSPAYNQQLSQRRAEAVVDYLATNFHIDRSRVQAIGMGEDGLMIRTPPQTPEERNRRVQVVNIGS
jgi:outer membrane protein OmpA-like peptidoglycan-associated protein